MDRPLFIRTSPRMPAPELERQMTEEFWRKQKEEIEAIQDFGEHAIPMTRLKKVIDAEKDKMLITFDTPSFLTKACEIFVEELAFRAWMCASSHHRFIILDTDIAEAIGTTESYDFLKDILHAFQEEQSSIASSKPTKKRHRSTNQPSTSYHPLNQVPHFAQYPLIVPIPHPLQPTNVHPMPLPFSFQMQQAVPPLMSKVVTPIPIVAPTMVPPINYMATGLGFFGNGINTIAPSNFAVSDNIVAFGAMTHPLQVCAGATANIPMANASAAAYDVCGAVNNIIVDVPKEIAETTSSMMHASDTAKDNTVAHQEQQIDLDDGPQQQHQVDGILDVVVTSASATIAGGDSYDVTWDELVIPDDSYMAKFWEDIMMDHNPAPLPDATASTDLLTSGTQDLEGSCNESHLFNDLSPMQAQSAADSPKAPN